MSTSSPSNIAVENIELNTSNDSISNVIGVLSNLEDSQNAWSISFKITSRNFEIILIVKKKCCITYIKLITT